MVAPELQLKVVPNPMKDGAWIRLMGQQGQERLTLRLFDVSGRVVRQIDGAGNEVWLERSDLMSGMYFFTLEKDGIWQASAKLVVE